MRHALLRLLALFGLVAFIALVLFQQLALAPAQAAGAVAPAAPQAPIPMPKVWMEYTAGVGLRLWGDVPTESEREALRQRARAVYGQTQVLEDLQVQPAANPPWLSPAFLPDLRQALHATARLADGTLTVHAVLADEAARHRLAQAIADYTAQGLRVSSSLRLDPAQASPVR